MVKWNSSSNARLRSSGLQHYVRPSPSLNLSSSSVPPLRSMRYRLFPSGLGGRDEYIVCAERSREIRLVAGLCPPDYLLAEYALRYADSDGPAPEDHSGHLALLYLTLVIQTATARLHCSSFFQVHMGWYRVAVICLSDIVLGERAVVCEGSRRRRCQAEVVGSCCGSNRSWSDVSHTSLFLLQIVTYCLHGTPGRLSYLSPTLRFLTQNQPRRRCQSSWPRTIGETE